MLTKTKIENAIRKKFKLNKDELVLWKTDGFWYWMGDLPSQFEEAWTGYNTIKDVSLGRWLEDFESKYIKYYRDANYIFNEVSDEEVLTMILAGEQS